ncbi:MAG: hypothetical protein H3C30_09035, partial [Candidatus Hydrogenedentes bacterium]|nr:hypothetical protein [Candidatus Hydrogenedentota bacterium]
TGVSYTPGADEGLLLPGRKIRFAGSLEQVPEMTVLTDFLVDRIYPVEAAEGTEPVAFEGVYCVGTLRKTAGGGSVAFLGFRPRDDQSGSLGYESRHWFEILDTLGAYPPTGAFPDVNDNTEHLSRTTPWLACRFPNGSVALAPHLRDVAECWPGGFARKPEEDAKIMERVTLPDDRLALDGFKVNGMSITYNGRLAMTCRRDESGRLAAFAGSDAKEITLDGMTTRFATENMPLVAWAPVEERRKVAGGADMLLFYMGQGVLHLPAPPDAGPNPEAFAQGATPGSRGEAVPVTLADGILRIEAGPQFAHRWIYIRL